MQSSSFETSFSRQKSLFTAANVSKEPQGHYNVSAQPFIFKPRQSEGFYAAGNHLIPPPGVFYIGPTNLPVNSRVWNSISAFPVPPRHCNAQENVGFSGYNNYETKFHHPGRQFGPVAVDGIIQLRLRDSILIEITLDKAIKLTNQQESITMALSNSGYSSALCHPNGTVYQNGARVDIVAYDGRKKNSFVRFAKMWQKGISLTSEGCALIYLVDSAGTRTTSDLITIDINADYIGPVFLNGSRYGSTYQEEALTLVRNSNFWLSEDGTETFTINGYRISQTIDGLVRVTRPNTKCTLRTSPSNGSATITTGYIHSTASLGQTSHLFVRREERRMHFDGASFVVRNAGHSAGFDESNRLRVY